MASSIADEITWFMFRTVFALKPLGCCLDSVRSTLPLVNSFL
ncbi:hypothetical protein [Acutalibacter caecimuris]|nr:hypothetical protein [Acutalibacter sp. M00118]